jgi:hypothetical protein
MLLISVQGMPLQDAMAFLQTEIKNRCIEKDRANINSVANNPESVMLFSELLRIPMLRETRIVNFSNLYSWRKITRTWLDHFLRFAMASFSYLGLPIESTDDEVGAEYFENVDSEETSFNFDFLDITFLDILDSNYRAYLSKEILVMGHQGRMVIDEGMEQSSHSWERAYDAYKKGVEKEVGDWVEAHVSQTGASENNEDLPWIQALESRIKVLLDLAYTRFPFIRALKCSVPLFCPAFLTDLATQIQRNESAYIEVSQVDAYTNSKYRTLSFVTVFHNA